MSSRRPEPTEGHATVSVGSKLHVWGGSLGSGSPKAPATTLETFDVSSRMWERPQKLQCSLPDGLMSMAVTADGGNAYFFGGRTGPDAYYNAVYRVNPSTLQCVELIPRNDPPREKAGSNVVYFNQNLVIYGGRTVEKNGVTDELLLFDLRTSEGCYISSFFLVYVIVSCPL